MSTPKDYDTTIARIAGNIAAGLVSEPSVNVMSHTLRDIAHTAVLLARAIVVEIKATEAPK